MPFRAAPPVAAAEIASGTSFPTPAEEGDCFYRTDLNEFYVYDGTDWVRWEIETHESEHESGGADEIPSGSLNPQDPTAHAASHESGGADALPLANLPMPGDDTKIQLGAGPDFSIFYDSTNDDFRIRDEVNAVETNLPKNVSMDFSSHAGRHEPGGADVTDAYVEGESAGLREEHGEIFNDEVATNTAVTGTVTFATAFSSKPHYIVSGGCDVAWMGEDQGRSGTDDEDPVTTSDLDWHAKNESSANVIDIWVEWLAMGS